MDLVKSKDFIVVHEFMVRDLRLKGNELLVTLLSLTFRKPKSRNSAEVCAILPGGLIARSRAF